MVLTADERELATASFYQGPAVLLEAGMSETQVRDFIEREDVQLEHLLLKREFDIHEGLRARAKFKLSRNLHRLIDGASAVIANGLAGAQYARDDDGNILRDGAGRPVLRQAAVSSTQLRAARLVMDGIGIADWRLRGDAATDPNTKLLFHATTEEVITIDHDPLHETEEDKALSRERVRNAIEALIPKLDAARDSAKEALGIDPASQAKRKRKVAKKRTKKKATKKATKKTVKKKATKKATTKKKATRKKTTRRGKTSG